jgi:MOSC domain-containing protein YiiM
MATIYTTKTDHRIMAVSAALSMEVTNKAKTPFDGRVVRLAARKYNPETSKPSSRQYTTRKDEFELLEVKQEGCQGDYNHYRTIAMKSTKDRAVSILTADVMASLRSTYYPLYQAPQIMIKDGDLGENILVDGVTFRFFEVGQRYCFDSSRAAACAASTVAGSVSSKEQQPLLQVILEITEPMEPCANLCKLPFINCDAIPPKERIQRCQDLILHLAKEDGYRGWYAKVVREGVICNGAKVTRMMNENDE